MMLLIDGALARIAYYDEGEPRVIEFEDPVLVPIVEQVLRQLARPGSSQGSQGGRQGGPAPGGGGSPTPQAGTGRHGAPSAPGAVPPQVPTPDHELNEARPPLPPHRAGDGQCLATMGGARCVRVTGHEASPGQEHHMAELPDGPVRW